MTLGDLLKVSKTHLRVSYHDQVFVIGDGISDFSDFPFDLDNDVVSIMPFYTEWFSAIKVVLK